MSSVLQERQTRRRDFCKCRHRCCRLGDGRSDSRLDLLRRLKDSYVFPRSFPFRKKTSPKENIEKMQKTLAKYVGLVYYLDRSRHGTEAKANF